MTAPSFPTPFVTAHEAFIPDAKDAHGDAIDKWAPAVPRPIYGAGPDMSNEPKIVGHERVIVDMVMLVPPDQTYGPRDRETIGGNVYECVGFPESTEFNPFGKHFGAVVNLRRVTG
ncbi:hypothetical protein [Mycobacteroides chelonae]|uniref:hypothetical protein n=1 Tax=Mycobacteroides chelonae TaxID=1774 RepID=UPI000994534A|nr:hypothetical protein [Mycobacteroides chelonae]